LSLLIAANRITGSKCKTCACAGARSAGYAFVDPDVVSEIVVGNFPRGPRERLNHIANRLELYAHVLVIIAVGRQTVQSNCAIGERMHIATLVAAVSLSIQRQEIFASVGSVTKA
jgi:hypothetical protein